MTAFGLVMLGKLVLLVVFVYFFAVVAFWLVLLVVFVYFFAVVAFYV